MGTDNVSKPSIFIIFGASGDLTWRKLVPALYNLFLDNWMPDRFKVLGLGLGNMTDAQFREHLRRGVDQFSRRGKSQQDSWKTFAENLHFETADLTNTEVYQTLARRLEEQDKSWDMQANRIFYLALPPDMIEPVTRRLADVHLNQDRRRARW